MEFDQAASDYEKTSVIAGLLDQAALCFRWKVKMSALTPVEIHSARLRSEIAQLEARYDGVFPPGVYAVLERLRRDLAALHNAISQ